MRTLHDARLFLQLPCLAFALAFSACASLCGQDISQANNENHVHELVPPTLANVSYGSHRRQVLDFWQAKSDEPTPVVFYMHGGGWMNGDKANIAKHFVVDRFLAASISMVAINYRYVWQAREAQVQPPVEWPMHDAKRALQFVRSKASEWKLDKERIALTGGSAGGCSCLWLAFHDDMADPSSHDPIARESTRPNFVAVEVPQTSLDPQQITAWTPNSRYGHHAFGVWSSSNPMMNKKRFKQFLDRRDEFLPWIREYSPFEHVSSDDPQVYLFYKDAPSLGKAQRDPTHTANYGVKLKEKLDQVRVPCELVYPGANVVKHPSIENYLMDHLGS